MAPQRKNTDENGTNGHGPTSTKEKSSSGAGVTKSKKVAGGSHLKDVTNAASLGENGTSGGGGGKAGAGDGQNGQNSSVTLDFNSLPRRALHTYRAAWNLHQPTSFRSFHNGILLSNPGSVGLQSPTMLRPKERRRIPKRQLARAVRSHFMDQSVSELDVEARMIYNVKSIDKAFRMKFTPNMPGKK